MFYSRGSDKGDGVSSLSVDEVEDQLLDFNKYATHGTKNSAVLTSYKVLREYIEITNDPNC